MYEGDFFNTKWVCPFCESSSIRIDVIRED
jgi:transposase-like protein